MATRGFFLTIESIDGLGKTTQLDLLDKGLRDAGYDIYRTKEPGDAQYGTCVSAGIRQLLFHNPTTKAMYPGVADCLFLADHIQNAGDVAKAVEAGKIVLCDRYADSQFAYAASTGKACPSWALNAYAENYGIVPDLTIFLRACGPQVTGVSAHEDISWALKRAQTRRGTSENGKQDGKTWNDAEDQRKVQAEYEALLMPEPRTLMIDVFEDTSIGDLHHVILVYVLNQLMQAGLYAQVT